MNRTTPPTIATLVIIAGAGPLNMNIILPALPAIEKYFQTPYVAVQLLVSAYLAMTAIMQIILGPLSDRYGRRPVMICSIVVTMAATLVCIFAPSFEVLLAGRLVQASVVAGIALSRATVRDLVEADEAASMIGYVTMGMSVMPMISPALGGYVSEVYGWQAPFWIGFSVSSCVLILVFLDMGETNKHKTASLKQQLSAYPELLHSRRFWGYALSAAFSCGSFYAFLGGGPFIATQILGMTPSSLGLYFSLTAVGYIIGNFISGRFARRVGINRMILLGNLVAALGMVGSFAFFISGIDHPISFFGFMTFIGLGNGISLPSANAGVVSARPYLAGSASGLGAALMIGGGAILSVVSVTMLSAESGPYPLLIVIFLSSIAGAIAALYVMHVSRMKTEESAGADLAT